MPDGDIGIDLNIVIRGMFGGYIPRLVPIHRQQNSARGRCVAHLVSADGLSGQARFDTV